MTGQGVARRKLTVAQRRQRGAKLSLGFRRAREKSYKETAKALSVFVPELKPLAKKSTFTPAQKAKISRRARQLKHVHSLVPIPKGSKEIEPFAKGINAVQLQDVHNAEYLKPIKGGGFLLVNIHEIKNPPRITQRTWIYWPLSRATVKSKSAMKKITADVFAAKFPIEIVTALAETAFRELKPLAVHLWVTSGRAKEGYEDFKGFLRYVENKWQAGRYISITEQGKAYDSDPEAFIKGIVVLVGETRLKRTKFSTKPISEMG